jgi:hypothetical protein
LAIQQRIQRSAFDSETVRIMVAAYEAARRELGLSEGSEPANQQVAHLVVQMAERGERDVDIMVKQIVMWMAQPK